MLNNNLNQQINEKESDVNMMNRTECEVCGGKFMDIWEMDGKWICANCIEDEGINKVIRFVGYDVLDSYCDKTIMRLEREALFSYELSSLTNGIYTIIPMYQDPTKCEATPGDQILHVAVFESHVYSLDDHMDAADFQNIVEDMGESYMEQLPPYETDGKFKVRKGDRITVKARGITITGTVVYACFWDHWDIEMTEATIPGGYSHWKQQYDGGQLIAVNGKEVK